VIEVTTMSSRFHDEINRLFDELVRTPWRQPRRAQAETHPLPHGIGWEIQIPLEGVDRNDISVTTEGQQLVVRVRRRSQQTRMEGGTEVTTSAQEYFRQSFSLPEGMQLGGIETYFERGVLRLRVELHKHDPAQRSRPR
jgi:HSP20 family molecular chaperone IbpA